MSWEFLTKVVGLEPDRLYPSIYLDDDEAYEIWNKDMGIPAERIFRFGKADNFWEHGPGPCGPCSEIYYDRGPEYGCGKPGCTVGCECDRYIEIWNNVFSQFVNDGEGHYEEMKNKNIDTGMPSGAKCSEPVLPFEPQNQPHADQRAESDDGGITVSPWESASPSIAELDTGSAQCWTRPQC